MRRRIINVLAIDAARRWRWFLAAEMKVLPRNSMSQILFYRWCHKR